MDGKDALFSAIEEAIILPKAEEFEKYDTADVEMHKMSLKFRLRMTKAILKVPSGSFYGYDADKVEEAGINEGIKPLIECENLQRRYGHISCKLLLRRMLVMTIIVPLAVSGAVMVSADSVETVEEPKVGLYVQEDGREGCYSFNFVAPGTVLSADNIPVVRQSIKIPSYLPDGCVPKNYINEQHQLLITYDRYNYSNRADRVVYYEQYEISAGVGVSDGDKGSPVRIGIDTFGFCVECYDNYVNLYWSDGCYGYEISGNMSKEEAIKMAESLKSVSYNESCQYLEDFKPLEE